jgi:hypothetical protein
MRTIQPKQKLCLGSNANPSSGRNRTCKAEKMFWEMMDQIRKEELGKLDLQSAEVRPKSKKTAGNP